MIAITGYADIQTAVDVLKLGACDFVMKPLIWRRFSNRLSGIGEQ